MDNKDILPLWEVAVNAWSVHAHDSGTARSSIASRRQQLGRLAKTIGAGPWEVSAGQLTAWFAGQPWANETRRTRRTTFRVFYQWAVEAGHITQSPAAHLPKVRPSVPRPYPIPDAPYAVALMAATDRERAMLRLGAEVGLRRGEVAVAHSRDIIPDLAGWSIVVHGKGGRERIIPLPDSLAATLRSFPAGYLFPGNDGGHLSPRWVGTLISRLLPDGYTMHKTRHRFATRAYEVERDIRVVQQLLGHASPATTAVYVGVDRGRLRATVEAAA